MREKGGDLRAGVAGRRMIARMASTHSLNKKPYRRVLPDEWMAIEAMYRAGATAKALAVEYDTTERTIYTRGREYGWLRKHQKAVGPVMTPDEADAAARALGAAKDGISGDAACRGLAADAPLDVAARAAARAAVGMLRDGHVGPAQTYARVAGLLARLGPTVEAGADVERDPEAEDAAMLYLMERLGIERV